MSPLSDNINDYLDDMKEVVAVFCLTTLVDNVPYDEDLDTAVWDFGQSLFNELGNLPTLENLKFQILT